MDHDKENLDIPPISDPADRFVAASSTPNNVIDLTAVSKKTAHSLKRKSQKPRPTEYWSLKENSGVWNTNEPSKGST